MPRTKEQAREDARHRMGGSSVVPGLKKQRNKETDATSTSRKARSRTVVWELLTHTAQKLTFECELSKDNDDGMDVLGQHMRTLDSTIEEEVGEVDARAREEGVLQDALWGSNVVNTMAVANAMSRKWKSLREEQKKSEANHIVAEQVRNRARKDVEAGLDNNWVQMAMDMQMELGGRHHWISLLQKVVVHRIVILEVKKAPKR